MTPLEALEALCSDEFEFSLGAITSPNHWRAAIRRTRQFQHLQQMSADGSLTDEIIRDFTERLTSQFQRGVRLPHEVALIGVTLLLEDRYSLFSDEFLHDLAKLRLSEIGNAIRVAGIILQNRSQPMKGKVILSPTPVLTGPRITVDSGTLDRKKQPREVFIDAAA